LSQDIVILSETAEDLEFAAALAREGGFGLRVVAESDFRGLNPGDESCAGFLFSADDPSIFHLVDQFLGPEVDANKVHAIIASERKAEIALICERPWMGSLVFRGFGRGKEDPGEAAKHYARTLKAARKPYVDGLRSVLGPDLAFTRFEFETAYEKGFAESQIRDLMIAEGWPARQLGTVCEAVDNLLLKTLFAPVLDAEGNVIPMAITPESYVEMQVAFDESYVCLAVLDRGGTLDRQQVLHYVRNAFDSSHMRRRADDVDGTSLAFALILNSGASLYIAREEHRRVEFMIFFRKFKPAARMTDFRDQFRFLATRMC
jgi:hypothetical protein